MENIQGRESAGLPKAAPPRSPKGSQKTVVRFFKKNGYYVLHPENETMADIVVNEVSILGKVVGLVRSFR